MMRVINWSFGSFFRTLGRIFAYIAIALILLFIGSKLNLFKTMEVNAATQINPTATYYSFRLCNINSSSYAESNCNWSSGTEVGTNTTPGTNLYATGFRVNMLFGNDTFKTDNTYTITLKMAINKPQYFASILDSPLSSKSLDQSCLGTAGSDCTNDNFKSMSVRVSNVSGNTFDYIITFTPEVETKYFRFAVYNNNPLYNGLTYDSGALLYKAMTYGRLNGYSATYETGIGSIIENSTIIIQNQNNQIIDGQNQINNNLNDLNDDIMNDDITDANNTANSFFDNFDTENHGGLSAIITSPISALNSMLNDTCVPFSVELMGETMSLPCGDLLWDRDGAQALKAFANLIFGIPILYGILIGFYKTIENLKDPNKDKVEVTKL